MKTQLNRIKTGAQSMSHRTIAMILCFVMLISTIGAGSVLTAIAQEFEPSGESVLAAAALSGADVTIPEDEEAETDKAADSSDDAAEAEDNDTAGKNLVDDLIARLRAGKEDLAATGADADFAETGDTTYYLWLAKNGEGNVASKYSNNGAMTASGSNYTASFTISTNANFDFCISTSSSDKWSGIVDFVSSSNITVSSEFNYPQFQKLNNDNTNYNTHFVHTNMMIVNSVTTVYVTFNPATPTVSISTTSSGSGGGTTETWTLAGSNTDLFGFSWTPSTTANDMTGPVSDVYTKVYTNVTTTSNIEFKVVKNHAWGTEYPSSNFVITRSSDSTKPRTLSESGTMYWISGDTLTFTFNSDTKAISVTSETPETTHDVTFGVSPSAGGSISPNVLTAVGVHTAQSVTATPNAAYNFAGWTLGDGIICADTSSSTISITTAASGAYTVQANFTAKPTYPITVTSSNAAYGTATSSPAYAYQGQTVTLTATEDTGTFQYWSGLSGITVTEGTVGDSGSAGTKTLKFTMPNNAVKVKANFNAYSGTSNYYYNGYNKSTGAQVQYASRFTKAKFNGQELSYYKVSGRTDVDQLFTVSLGKMDYEGKAYVGFQAPTNWGTGYWYGEDGEQYIRFFASDGSSIKDFSQMSHDSSLDDSNNNKRGYSAIIPDGARWVQVKYGRLNHYSQWFNLNTKAYADGGNGGVNSFYLQGKDLKSGSDWMIYGFDHDFGSDKINHIGDVYEYFNDNNSFGDNSGVYVSQYNTVGFNTINDFKMDIGDGTKSDESHKVSYPNRDMSSYGDYYILVLEPNTSYTLNGVTRTTGSNIEVIWQKELPAVDNASTVKVYAKDSAIRDGYTTYGVMADTKIYDSDGIAVNADTDTGAATYETYTATKGETITIKTTINNNYGITTSPAQKYSDQYYVRGFLVNGEVPKETLNTSGISGGTAVTGGVQYTLTYTIPEDFEGKYIEITPVYYLVDTVNNQTVTFYVDNFTPELQAISDNGPNWGDTIYAYPFYSTLGGTNNAFGQYPGQPLIFYNGRYSVQIPIYDTSPFAINHDDDGLLTSGTDSGKLTQRRAIRISGITLHNGYYDTVHRTVMEYKHNGDGGSYQYRYQTQTYDFDDFYKIYHEKDDVDNIVFQFKYKEYVSGTDNLTLLGSFTPSNAASFTTQFDNDFEDLLNFHKRKVNIYGDVLSGSSLSNNPVYVVSKAGASSVENTVGHYATEWVIYVPSAKTGSATYSKVEVSGGKSSIPPSLLLLNSQESFSDTMYPSAVSGYKTTDWKAYYNLLANYKDCPVKITYEEAKYDVSGDKATRSDGRWLYSKNGENITSNIRIDVNTSDSDGTYVTNGTGGVNISGLSAYFTNPEANGQTTYATTIDPDKTFDFTAVTSNPDYIFEGWYLDNGTPVTKDNSGKAERSANYTLVARFRHHTSGILMLNHSRGTDDDDFKGNGATKMTVTVVDGDGVIVRKDENVSEVTLPESIIKTDNNNYTIKVTLTATPSGDDKFEKVILSNKNADGSTNSNITGTFFDGSMQYTTMPGEFTFKVEDLFSSNTQNVKLLSYISYFSAPTYTYQIKYQYTSKLLDGNGSRAIQTFIKKGTMTPAEGSAYVTKDGESRILSTEFINKIAPWEENYGETKTWTIPESTYRTFRAGTNNTFSLDMTGDNIVTSVISATADTRTITYELPYLYDGTGNAKFEETASASAYAKGSAPYMTTSKNYVLTVPYGKVPKPRYNTLSDKMVQHADDVDEVDDDLYVVAPDTLDTSSSDSTKLHFQYWRVYSNKKSVEVARCYTTKFTFAALGDYTITPIYEATQSQDPLTGMAATISYLGPSRNQWNYQGWGNAAMIGANDTEAQTASDLLFQDFVCAYYYHGEKIYTGENTNLQTGYVVDRIGYLETFDGTTVTKENRATTLTKANTNTSCEQYETKYASSLATDKANIESYLKGTASKPSNISIVNFNSNSLDNKDRIQNFYSVYNSVDWNTATESPLKNYAYKYFIYRAFAYIKDSRNNTVSLSEPVYFTMYDIAMQNEEG